MIGKKN